MQVLHQFDLLSTFGIVTSGDIFFCSSYSYIEIVSIMKQCSCHDEPMSTPCINRHQIVLVQVQQIKLLQTFHKFYQHPLVHATT
jgi:hypothetical protein